MADTKTIASEAKTGTTDKDGKTDEVKPLPKVAKLTKKDWAKVEAWLKDQHEQRKNSDVRRLAEQKWREIDRQVAMNPMQKVNRDGAEIDQGWHNVVELGELSRASENITGDSKRITFPKNLNWFEVHADIEDALPLDRSTGEKKKNAKLQEAVNGRLRAMMSQQHEDFMLPERVELSIKEALHHGSFVAECDWETQEFVFEAVKTKSKSAPVWRPWSMWNAWLDPSPSVLGTNLFYDGSLFLEEYLPRYKAERMVKSSEDGWMATQWKKVNKDEHKGKDGEKIRDVKITKYYGDLHIERADETLWFPNHKAILMNGTLVYMAPNKTPYPPVIVRHYERLDVRDPYGTSPIMKQSPMQKLGSQLANKGMDGIELQLEPPIVYDGNDPDFVLNGGPVIAPGAKVSTKGSNAFSQITVGDPTIAVNFLQFIMGDMKEKLGRPGRPVGDRATKAEVVKNEQDEEVAVANWIGKLEQGMKSFLYMQHAMNLDRLEKYPYYSPEMQDPDFLMFTKKDLPKAVHFEAVGARGVLGEEERAQKFTTVAAFTSQNPLFAPRLDVDAHLMQMYQDAGVKNPERFLVVQGEESAGTLRAKLAQYEQALQKMQGMLQEEKRKTGVQMAKIKANMMTHDQKQRAESQAKREKLMVEHQDRMAKIKADFEAKITQIRADMVAEMRKLFSEHVLEQQKMFAQAMQNGGEGKGGTTIVDTSGKSLDFQKSIEELGKAVAKIGEKKGSGKKTLKGKKVNGEWQLEVTEN